MSLTVSVLVTGNFVGCTQTELVDFGLERTGQLVQKLQLRNMDVTELTRCVTSVVGEAKSPDESDDE
jgi:hypothetical protein